jgi:hypothetical protein
MPQSSNGVARAVAHPMPPDQWKQTTGGSAAPELTATLFCSCRRRESGHIKHWSVITQRGKKTIGSEHENCLI